MERISNKMKLTKEDIGVIFQITVLMFEREMNFTLLEKGFKARHLKTAQKLLQTIREDWDEYTKIDLEREAERKKRWGY